MENKKIKQVLVVEDESSLSQAIKIKLEKDNYEVLTAQRVNEAWDILTNVENNICAIWLDHYLLGKGNGLDLTVMIRNNNKLKDIPIFIVSNTASSEKVKSYEKLGVRRYFIKSNYRLEEIISEMEECLKVSCKK